MLANTMTTLDNAKLLPSYNGNGTPSLFQLANARKLIQHNNKLSHDSDHHNSDESAHTSANNGDLMNDDGSFTHVTAPTSPLSPESHASTTSHNSIGHTDMITGGHGTIRDASNSSSAADDDDDDVFGGIEHFDAVVDSDDDDNDSHNDHQTDAPSSMIGTSDGTARLPPSAAIAAAATIASSSSSLIKPAAKLGSVSVMRTGSRSVMHTIPTLWEAEHEIMAAANLSSSSSSSSSSISGGSGSGSSSYEHITPPLSLSSSPEPGAGAFSFVTPSSSPTRHISMASSSAPGTPHPHQNYNNSNSSNGLIPPASPATMISLLSLASPSPLASPLSSPSHLSHLAPLDDSYLPVLSATGSSHHSIHGHSNGRGSMTLAVPSSPHLRGDGLMLGSPARSPSSLNFMMNKVPELHALNGSAFVSPSTIPTTSVNGMNGSAVVNGHHNDHNSHNTNGYSMTTYNAHSGTMTGVSLSHYNGTPLNSDHVSSAFMQAAAGGHTHNPGNVPSVDKTPLSSPTTGRGARQRKSTFTAAYAVAADEDFEPSPKSRRRKVPSPKAHLNFLTNSTMNGMSGMSVPSSSPSSSGSESPGTQARKRSKSVDEWRTTVNHAALAATMAASSPPAATTSDPTNQASNMTSVTNVNGNYSQEGVPQTNDNTGGIASSNGIASSSASTSATSSTMVTYPYASSPLSSPYTMATNGSGYVGMTSPSVSYGSYPGYPSPAASMYTSYAPVTTMTSTPTATTSGTTRKGKGRRGAAATTISAQAQATAAAAIATASQSLQNANSNTMLVNGPISTAYTTDVYGNQTAVTTANGTTTTSTDMMMNGNYMTGMSMGGITMGMSSSPNTNMGVPSTTSATSMPMMIGTNGAMYAANGTSLTHEYPGMVMSMPMTMPLSPVPARAKAKTKSVARPPRVPRARPKRAATTKRKALGKDDDDINYMMPQFGSTTHCPYNNCRMAFASHGELEIHVRSHEAAAVTAEGHHGDDASFSISSTAFIPPSTTNNVVTSLDGTGHSSVNSQTAAQVAAAAAVAAAATASTSPSATTATQTPMSYGTYPVAQYPYATNNGYTYTYPSATPTPQTTTTTRGRSANNRSSQTQTSYGTSSVSPSYVSYVTSNGATAATGYGTTTGYPTTNGATTNGVAYNGYPYAPTTSYVYPTQTTPAAGTQQVYNGYTYAYQPTTAVGTSNGGTYASYTYTPVAGANGVMYAQSANGTYVAYSTTPTPTTTATTTPTMNDESSSVSSLSSISTSDPSNTNGVVVESNGGVAATATAAASAQLTMTPIDDHTSMATSNIALPSEQSQQTIITSNSA